MRYFLLFFFFFLTLPVFSQTEEPDSLNAPNKTSDLSNVSPLRKFEEPKVFVPLYFMESFSAVGKFDMGFRKFDDLSLPNRPADQLKLLYKQYEKDQEYKLLYSILGTVQTSAVAYMAYEHIKKYGLLK
jgi:hypothetical protein